MRRWPVRMPGDVYRSAHGLADASISRLCALRADLAVPGNPQHDQPRVRCVQLLPSQSPALKRSRAEVFDHHVGAFDHFAHQRLPFGEPQIDSDA